MHVSLAPALRTQNISDLRAPTLRVDAPERAGSEQLSAGSQLDSEAQVVLGRQCKIPGDHCTPAVIVLPNRRIPVAHYLWIGVDLKERRDVRFPQGPKLESGRSNWKVREGLHNTAAP